MPYTDYTVIIEASGSLEFQVKCYLQQGWQLVGGVAVGPDGTLYQAMAK